MRRLSVFAGVSAAALALSACVAPSEPAPRPAPPVPVPAPAPTPAPTPPPPSADWRDWPLTPGNWSYRSERSGSSAAFASLTIQCDLTNRRIIVTRLGAAPGQMLVRTSSIARTLATQPATPQPGASATLPANDPLIDAMGYSRGRFVVEGGGLPTLVVPAWAEILRVAEDCRG